MVTRPATEDQTSLPGGNDPFAVCIVVKFRVAFELREAVTPQFYILSLTG
jgi:hypothetical protein